MSTSSVLNNTTFLSLNNECISKEFVETLNKEDVLKLCRECLYKKEKELSKLNRESLDIFSKNVNIIFSVLSKYEIEELAERDRILTERSKYNKILYEPVNKKRCEVENIRMKIILLENEIADKKEPNAFNEDINDQVENSNLVRKIKKLNKEYNFENKNLQKLEEIYKKEMQLTCIPFTDAIVYMSYLKNFLKLIKKCERKHSRK